MPPDSTGKGFRAEEVCEIYYTGASGYVFTKGDHIRTNTTSGYVHGFIMEVESVDSETGYLVVNLHNPFQTPNEPTVGNTINNYITDVATIGSYQMRYHNISINVGYNNPYQGQYVDPYGAAYVRYSDGAPLFNGNNLQEFNTYTPLAFYTFDSTNISTELVGGGLVTENDAERKQVLSVTSASGDESHVETDRFHPTRINTSSLYLELPVQLGDTGKANNVRRWGIFHDEGIFFELNGTTLNCVRRSEFLGSPYGEETVAQGSWSIDNVDGSSGSISQFVLDVTKINKYWIEITNSGAVGSARLGVFDDSGGRITCHEFAGYNQSAQPWMHDYRFPAHIENINTGATSGTSEINYYSFSLFLTGMPAEIFGKTFETCMDYPQESTSIATWSHLISLRPKALDSHGDINRKLVVPKNISISSRESADLSKPARVKIEVWEGTTITGGGAGSPGGSPPDNSLWHKVKDNSEANLANDTTWSGGTAITEWVVEGNQIIELSDYFSYMLNPLHNNADGTQVVWTMGVKKLDSTTDPSVIAAIVWEEI